MVSLLEMLEFSAEGYVEMSHQIGALLARMRKPPFNSEDVCRSMEKLLDEVNRLGLFVTREAIGRFLIELVKANRDKSSLEFASDGDKIVRVKDGQLDLDRWAFHLEAIYATLRAELSTLAFRIVPARKTQYCDPKWLIDSKMYIKYPDTIDEFQRAGRCFAYDENAACVFHLMRVTEFYLTKVAQSLSTSFDPLNWGAIGNFIRKEMEAKYQDKTDAWRKSEPFYATILTDIQAISRGHRNPALHALDKKYEEREAKYLLTVIEEFAHHTAAQL
jgi:hypothetical protein